MVLPGPIDLMAQIQLGKKKREAATASASNGNLTNAGGLGAVAVANPKKQEAPSKMGDGPFSFDASLQAFLFFAETEKPYSAHSFVVADANADANADADADADADNNHQKDVHNKHAKNLDIHIPLAPCIYRMTDYTIAKQEPITLERTLLKLNVIRCLARECQTLNALLKAQLTAGHAMEEEELSKTRFMELLSNCGVSQKVSELILQRAAQIADDAAVLLQADKKMKKETSKSNNNNNNSLRVLQIHIDGLDNFLAHVETLTPALQQARTEIDDTQTVSFYPGLGELFSPGSKLVCHPEGMEGSPLGCSVVQSWYTEDLNKASGKMKRRFVLCVEFVVSVGDELVFVAASDVYPEFHDVGRNAPMKDLKHRKLLDLACEKDAALLERLQQRGEFYASVATKNHYLEYYPDSFFPIIGGGWNSNAVRPLAKGGRVMVDVKRGILEGHLPVRGSNSDGMADTVKEAIKLFGQSKRTGVAVPFRTAILPDFNDGAKVQHKSDRVDSDRHLLWQAWPMLTGFSFTARVWGKLLLGMPKPSLLPSNGPNIRRPSTRRMGVEVAALGGEGSCGNCGYIKFQEAAFDQLVLAEDKKELIRAVARNSGGGGTTKWSEDDDDSDDDDDVGIDVVANKGGASIFLLSGPPGTGKTLTAEAIAELLRKPLYIVTAGDLGITASEVEKTLGLVLELCQTWDALVLIDEADVFLEARNSTEIERNALVCVMLRLLEYYSGCLFLSSNRSAASIDAAIASRITVMLNYPPLDSEGRAKVWKNLIELVPTMPVDPTTGMVPERISDNARKASKYRLKFDKSDYSTLAFGYRLNGRQIKNTIVLARALAKERGLPLSLVILRCAVTAVAGEEAVIKAAAGTY